ncbi:MAG: indole-3-glycerol phosphate synthase TrpC [Schumannella sp.]
MLDELVAGALEDAAARRAERDLARVEADALAPDPAVDAVAALAPGSRVKIIAEVKARQPLAGRAGPRSPTRRPSRVSYQTGGASAISVLTEGRRFGGSLADLESVRAAVELPVLRKDFIAEPYQVFEARAAGADLVLLIVAALDDRTLAELHTLIGELGMTALVETHSAAEVDRALDIGATVVGVNARDLTTFELDRDLFGSLADRIPSGVIRIAESAVLDPSDVTHYREAGADVVLIGEALVRGENPVETLEQFLAAGA